MTALLPTTRKICWFSLNYLFQRSSDEPQTSTQSQSEKKEDESLKKRQRLKLSSPDSSNKDSTAVTDRSSAGVTAPSNTLSLRPNKKYSTQSNKDKKQIHNCNSSAHCAKANNNTTMDSKSGSKYESENFKESYSSWCNCVVSDSGQECSKKRARLTFDEAPFYLKFNPYITGGYRNNLSKIDALKSILWWTNETMNIWSHLGGFAFFLAVTVSDSLGLIDLPKTQPWDQVVITLLLLCFMACMLLSSLYHIFCCCSEKFYRNWLSADLFGVSFCLLAIYISGIYYAFSCVPFWLNFYLVTVLAIAVSVIFMQIMPMVNKEDRFQWRLLVFGGWAAYGVVPTFHWTLLHGGFESEAVGMLLPRIVWIYIISGAAFFFYVARLPERVCPGIVNYIGSSHQIWHILIVLALYHWHNTGIMYLKFRATHPCTEEYKTLYSIDE